MDIKVLTTGCSHCSTLENRVQRALEEANVEAEIETVDDMQEIMSHGIMSVPALLVDGEIVSTGDPPSVREITDLLRST